MEFANRSLSETDVTNLVCPASPSAVIPMAAASAATTRTATGQIGSSMVPLLRVAPWVLMAPPFSSGPLEDLCLMRRPYGGGFVRSVPARTDRW